MVVQKLIHKSKIFRNLKIQMGICLCTCMVVLKLKGGKYHSRLDINIFNFKILILNFQALQVIDHYFGD